MSQHEVTTELLTHRIDRVNRYMKYSVIGLCVVTLITMVFIVTQLFAIQKQLNDTLTGIKDAGSTNHRLTRQYVKCIADNLLKPVSERSRGDFAQCGIVDVEGETKASSDKKRQDNSATAVNPQPTTSPQPATANSDRAQVGRTEEPSTGGKPPEPEQPEQPEEPQPQGLRALPLVGPILGGLGL